MKRLFFSILAAFLFITTGCDDKDKDIAIDCSDYDYDKVHLLEAILKSDGSIYRTFEYDNQDRIEKMIEYNEESYEITSTFYYSENDLVKIVSDGFYNEDGKLIFDKDVWEIEFTKNEGKLIITEKHKYSNYINTTTLDLNSDGYNIGVNPSMSMNGRSYTVMNCNLTNYTRWAFSSMGAGTQNTNYYDYKYDKNKSPFYNCKTPAWYLFYNFLELGSQNNATEIIHTYSGYWGYYQTTTQIKYVYNCAGYPTKRTETIDGVITDVLEYKYK